MSMFKFVLTFKRPVLATNPCDLNVMDQHIIDKQRKMIIKDSNLQKEINKYLGALEISKDKGEAEVNKIIDKLEELMGYTFTDQERKDAVAGKLDSLKETFKELDIKGTTVFFWDKETNKPCIGDHMIYCYMKAASEAISRTLPKKNGKVLHSSAHTSKLVNQHVRCEEWFIPFNEDVMRTEEGMPEYLQRSLRAMTAQGPRVTLAKSEQVNAGAQVEFTLNVLDKSELDDIKILKRIFDHGMFFGIGQWRNAGYGMFTYTIEEIK